MIDKQLLLQGCKQFEIELSTQAAEQLDTYAQLLVEWNGKMNLTAITDPQGIVFKHFVDSLLLLKAVELPQGSSLIDVGAGAGFPSHAGEDCPTGPCGDYAGQLTEKTDLFRGGQSTVGTGLHLHPRPRRGWRTGEKAAGAL